MKLILLPLLILFLSETKAQPEAPLSSSYISKIKLENIDKQLKEIGPLKDCAEKESEADRLSCANEQLSQIEDPEQLGKIAEQLELKKFGLVKSHAVKDIQKFIRERIAQGLHGKDFDLEKQGHLLNQQNYVDQSTFVELQHLQTTKDLMMEISNYCLKHFLINKPGFSVQSDIKFHNTISDMGEMDSDLHQKKMDELKSLSATEAENDYKKCLSSIQTLCKFQADNPNQEIGKKSCLMQDRMITYKKNLEKLEDTIGKFDEMKKDRAIAQIAENVFKGSYHKNKSAQSIDEITTINSTEIAEKMNSDQYREDFSANCEQNDDLAREDCYAFGTNDQDKLDKAKFVLDAQKLAHQKKIKALQEQNLSKEEASQKAKELNLWHEDMEKLDSNQILAEIDKKYAAQKDALKSEIEKQITGHTSLKNQDDYQNGQDADIQKYKTAVSKKLENQKDSIRNLVLFNNIVSIYAQVGDDKETFGSGIEAEIANNEQEKWIENFYKDYQKDSGRNISSTSNHKIGISADALANLLFGIKQKAK